MEAIELPPEVLQRLGQKATALVALSNDDLTRLRHDFALTTTDAKAINESGRAAA